MQVAIRVLKNGVSQRSYSFQQAGGLCTTAFTMKLRPDETLELAIVCAPGIPNVRVEGMSVGSPDQLRLVYALSPIGDQEAGSIKIDANYQSVRGTIEIGEPESEPAYWWDDTEFQLYEHASP